MRLAPLTTRPEATIHSLTMRTALEGELLAGEATPGLTIGWVAIGAMQARHAVEDFAPVAGVEVDALAAFDDERIGVGLGILQRMELEFIGGLQRLMGGSSHEDVP